ncbi:MAG: Anaerobic sulfatase-maturating enzyme [Syntrophomonadaceae bacterium]|nr:Anaerobic sulfatase-maturating enzyme [Bacillota bacterium]MBT9147405.1 Anaerobic sulfatase-maturating enzyme [Bacillota bacterium]
MSLDIGVLKILKKSSFGHFFQKGEVTCAYNALRIITIYFDSSILPYLTMVPGKPIDEILAIVPAGLKDIFVKTLTNICQAHILVPNTYDELDYLEKVKAIAFKGPRVHTLVLHLTDNCNLRCRYCYIEGNIPKNYERRNMSAEVAEKAIDKFGQIIKARNFPKPPTIIFYGGEPLINWKTLKHCLDYVRRKQKIGFLPLRLGKLLITNGTLVTAEIAKELRRHRVSVAVSIDGPKEIHDLNRVYRNGKGSFEDTIRGFRILGKEGLSPSVSGVLNKESVDNPLYIVRWIIEKLNAKALGFNHVSIFPGSPYDPVYEEKFGDALIKVQEMIQSDYPKVYERRFNRKINNFLDRRLLHADCTGCGEQMVCSPDGQLGVCQAYMGTRKTFKRDCFNQNYDPNQDPMFIEWSYRSPLNMTQCYECPALATCGGGCPRNADAFCGSIWEVDAAFCQFARKAQEWMIWKKYETRGRCRRKEPNQLLRYL